MNTETKARADARSNVLPALWGEADVFSPNGFLCHAINSPVSLAR